MNLFNPFNHCDSSSFHIPPPFPPDCFSVMFLESKRQRTSPGVLRLWSLAAQRRPVPPRLWAPCRQWRPVWNALLDFDWKALGHNGPTVGRCRWAAPWDLMGKTARKKNGGKKKILSAVFAPGSSHFQLDVVVFSMMWCHRGGGLPVFNRTEEKKENMCFVPTLHAYGSPANQSKPVHSNPFQSKPVYSKSVQSIPIQTSPIHSNPFRSNPIHFIHALITRNLH